MSNSSVSSFNKTRMVRRAPVVASIVALVLVTVKIIVGLITGSMMLVASAVDSGLDFLVSAFNYIAIRSAEKPSDEIFNYGRGKIKSAAAVLEGLVIAVSSLFIIGGAVYKIFFDDPLVHAEPAIWVMIFSTVVTGALVLYLNRVARISGDLVVKADALHYKVDLWSNLGILSALAFIAYYPWPYIDPLISICIGLYIFREAMGLMRKGMMMLLDRALEDWLVEGITTILNDAPDCMTGWHLLRTRQSGDVYFVDVHLVFVAEISLREAHKASDQLEARITALEDRAWIINCHFDPVDDEVEDLEEQPI